MNNLQCRSRCPHFKDEEVKPQGEFSYSHKATLLGKRGKPRSPTSKSHSLSPGRELPVPQAHNPPLSPHSRLGGTPGSPWSTATPQAGLQSLQPPALPTNANRGSIPGSSAAKHCRMKLNERHAEHTYLAMPTQWGKKTKTREVSLFFQLLPLPLLLLPNEPGPPSTAPREGIHC